MIRVIDKAVKKPESAKVVYNHNSTQNREAII